MTKLASRRPAEEPRSSSACDGFMPTLFGGDTGLYAMRGNPFLLSFLLHTLATILLLTSGVYVVRHRAELARMTSSVMDISPYILPAAADRVAGGGGGGDRDKLAAPKGALPKQSDQQLAPPAVVIRNPNPILAVEPTVVVPPNIVLPHSGPLGDPLSSVLGAPSNGTGSGGGIGSGSGGGVGSGRGPGVGPGSGGGIGGGVYRVGGGISAPRVLYAPEPEFTEEARKAKYQGTVVLWMVISSDGRPLDIRVQRALGMGLDESAISPVKRWRFEPARKDGVPVAVQVSVEVNFRLF